MCCRTLTWRFAWLSVTTLQVPKNSLPGSSTHSLPRGATRRQRKWQQMLQRYSRWEVVIHMWPWVFWGGGAGRGMLAVTAPGPRTSSWLALSIVNGKSVLILFWTSFGKLRHPSSCLFPPPELNPCEDGSRIPARLQREVSGRWRPGLWPHYSPPFSLERKALLFLLPPQEKKTLLN